MLAGNLAASWAGRASLPPPGAHHLTPHNFCSLPFCPTELQDPAFQKVVEQTATRRFLAVLAPHAGEAGV